MKIKILLVASTSFFVCSLLGALECTDQEWPDYFTSVNSTITLRHIEPEGLGYKHGYSTLSGQFFTPGLACNTVWPFLDLRGHYFNDSEWAGNGGIGVRYAPDEWCTVVGVNGFVDYRGSNHKRFHYFQVGIGFELLGECWDFRVNGYLPIDARRTIRKCFFDYPGGYFIKQNKFQSAMQGISGEIGRYICRSPCSQIYLGLGPYYYGGRGPETKVGGRFRAFFKFRDHFAFQGVVYYDNTSGFIAQGLIGIQFYLGCAPKCCLRQQIISQPVYRNEIIVLDEFCKWKSNF